MLIHQKRRHRHFSSISSGDLIGSFRGKSLEEEKNKI